MSIESAISTVTGTLRGIINLGLGLAVVFLVVDILVPGTTGIVGNVSELVDSFVDQGIVGLITLVVFVAIFLGDD
jgi:hypothetical protein